MAPTGTTAYGREPLPASAEVVIIGGGIIGTSIAFHLAEAGVRDIVLIERDRLGSGSSGKPLGGVRATFSDPGNIQLGHRSLEIYEGFAERFHVDIGLCQVGYLFLCRTDAELETVRESTVIQRQHGGSSRMVTPAQIRDLNPLVDPIALTGGSFSPRDGFAEPARVVAAYAAAARQWGVTICEETEVLDISGERVVETSRGALSAQTVIVAAGAWSTRIGRMLGVELPVEPVRRQIGFTAPTARPFPTVPFTLDLGSTLYFHNAADQLLLGISDAGQAPGFGREFSREWLAAFDEAAREVAPGLAGVRLTGGWAGLYENTPDHNAMIGRADDAAGVFYATGFSGHGFLQGPAVGEMVRDLYLEREPAIDPTPFNARRFAGLQASLSELHII